MGNIKNKICSRKLLTFFNTQLSDLSTLFAFYIAKRFSLNFFMVLYFLALLTLQEGTNWQQYNYKLKLTLLELTLN